MLFLLCVLYTQQLGSVSPLQTLQQELLAKDEMVTWNLSHEGVWQGEKERNNEQGDRIAF